MRDDSLPCSHNLDVVAKRYTNILGSSEHILQLCDVKPLRVGTMCSGTEAPKAVFRALSKALGGKPLIDHIFSCEYDPRKRD